MISPGRGVQGKIKEILGGKSQLMAKQSMTLHSRILVNLLRNNQGVDLICSRRNLPPESFTYQYLVLEWRFMEVLGGRPASVFVEVPLTSGRAAGGTALGGDPSLSTTATRGRLRPPWGVVNRADGAPRGAEVTPFPYSDMTLGVRFSSWSLSPSKKPLRYLNAPLFIITYLLQICS